MTRVTENMIYSALSRDVSRAQAQSFEAQRRAATGRRVDTASDDPVATGRAAVLQSGIERLSGMGRAADRARNQLATADSTLGEAENLMVRAREIALAAANATLTADERAIQAEEVERLREQMLAFANTQVEGTRIFGGYQTANEPFLVDGTYVGDSGVRWVEVAPGVQVAMNVPGDVIFNPAGGEDVFGLLERLRDALRADDVPATTATLDGIDTALAQLSGGRAGVGVTMASLFGADATRGRLNEEMTTELSGAVEVDAAASYVELARAQNALQSAISQATSILANLRG